jgi:GNAT superfamily N-acetyltransferase
LDTTQTEITLTRFGPEHIAGAVALSTSAGWPHRAEDWELVCDLSSGIAATQGSRVVATAIATPFGSVGTVNMIIVDEALRGRGLGRKIMTEAMDEYDFQEWRLVATRDGYALYEKLGFEPCGEVQQFQGTVKSDQLKGSCSEPDREGLVQASQKDLFELAELDKAATGMDRTLLVRVLLDQGRVLCVSENGVKTAWAALRRFGRGEVAGPVIASNREEAQRLLSAFLLECNGRFLRVDTMADTGLGGWLEGFGLTHAGGGIAMRKGTPGAVSKTHRTFALASQALG